MTGKPDWLSPARAAYVHIPFCQKKCLYCDFLSFTDTGRPMIRRYLAAVQAEIRRTASWASSQGWPFSPILSVYFGGGTPSLLPAVELADILACIRQEFGLDPEGEYTLEANPGTVSEDHLLTCRQAGFNRISIGLQASQSHLLQALGRIHLADDFSRTVWAARAAGFQSISADIMFGLPGQTQADVEETVSFLLRHPVDHVSYYGLILEPGTPLELAFRNQQLTLPDDEEERDQYHLIRRLLSRSGLQPYEISSSAAAGHRCRHNLVYWHALPYYGFGLGAHSYLAGLRRGNTDQLETYLAILAAEPVTTADRDFSPISHDDPFPQALILEKINTDQARQEMMLLGLRLQEGVRHRDFEARFGLPMQQVFTQALAELQQRKLLILDRNGARLTDTGLDLANQVFQYFV